MQKNDHRRIDGCDSHEAIFKTMTLNRNEFHLYAEMLLQNIRACP